MVPGDATRPVMDRVKEALFNILSPAIEDAAWLDLFAGTGSVGIEALSRGAARVVFVDSARLAVHTIHENLAITGLAERARVVRADVFEYLARPPAQRFDVVYVAPPQYQSLWKETLLKLDAQPDWLNPDGIVVVQVDPREREAVTLHTLEAYDERTYGNTQLWFFERPGE
ncbi:MAG: 16S rRNA (guanine(966)-N(2))-methyltransferase RsmD [Anaerolineae bacterium]|nr:16S rRNA (guanine(966)-N(2))-methyltransferase RsmD [Anaerolineae bacterium]